MAIYFIEIAMILLLWWMLHGKRVKVLNKTINGEATYLFIVFLILICIMAFRASSIGTDTGTYYRMFINISNTNTFTDAVKVSRITAPVYVAYVFLLSRIVKIPQVVTVMNSIIVGVGIYKFIKKTSAHYFYSVMLYVCLPLFFESMNGTRQFMAIGLALNAFLYLIESKKSVKGWILLLLAIGIHNTAIVFGVAILSIVSVEKAENDREIFMKSLIMSLGVVFTFQVLMNFIVRFFPYYTMYLNGNNAAQITSESGNGRIILLYFILAIALLIVIYFRRGKIDNKLHDEKTKYVSYIIPSITFCVVMGISNAKNILINRLLWYFLTMFIVLMPNGYQLLKTKQKKLLCICTILVISVYGLFHLIEDKSGIVPYVFFWN